MIQRREDFRFALEAGQPFGIARERSGQHLDRYFAIQFGVARFIHLSHASRTERCQDLIGT